MTIESPKNARQQQKDLSTEREETMEMEMETGCDPEDSELSSEMVHNMHSERKLTTDKDGPPLTRQTPTHAGTPSTTTNEDTHMTKTSSDYPQISNITDMPTTSDVVHETQYNKQMMSLHR